MTMPGQDFVFPLPELTEIAEKGTSLGWHLVFTLTLWPLRQDFYWSNQTWLEHYWGLRIWSWLNYINLVTRCQNNNGRMKLDKTTHDILPMIYHNSNLNPEMLHNLLHNNLLRFSQYFLDVNNVTFYWKYNKNFESKSRYTVQECSRTQTRNDDDDKAGRYLQSTWLWSAKWCYCVTTDLVIWYIYRHQSDLSLKDILRTPPHLP